MLIWDPVGDWLDAMLYPEKEWRYVCTLNGVRSFRGEELPVGTRAEIETWICDRFKLLGELTLSQSTCGYLVWYQQVSDWWSWRRWGAKPSVVRLLVVVDGDEYLFRLAPVPGLCLTWDGNGCGLPAPITSEICGV